MNEENKNIIIIDLEKHNDAIAFENENEIIQIESLNDCLNHINQSLTKITSFKDDLLEKKSIYKKRYHDTISVFGSRGTGKTTFILNLFKSIETSSKQYNSNYDFKDKIELLDILDPTLVGSKEHVFLNIISRIKSAVEYHHQKSSHNEGIYNDWLYYLQKLAKGLHAIDGVGNNLLEKESWHDPIYVMEQGLSSVKASNELETNFHLYVNKSLELLNKKAFLIAFDDIDTDFLSGWPVLETIRKYLTTPQLITILSGDEALYSKLIRKKQWQNFGKELIENEHYNFEKYNSLVDKLEKQYLLKVLKPERRLTLKKLTELHFKKIHVRTHNIYKTKYEVKELKEFINENLKEKWFLNNYDQFLFNKILLNEPIRTIIQLLIILNTTRQPDSISSLYLVTLQKFNFDINFFLQNSQTISLNTLANALKENSLLERGYRLKPEFQEIETNRLMIVLSFLYSNLIEKDKSLFFDYFIKIGLAHQIAITSHKNIEIFYKYTGLKNGEDSTTISRLFVGFLRAFLDKTESHQTNKKEVFRGTVWLKKNSGFDNIYNFHYNTHGSICGFLLGIPAVYIIEPFQTSTHFSIHSLLAFIGEILRCSDKKEMKELFLLRSQIRYYESPLIEDQGIIDTNLEPEMSSDPNDSYMNEEFQDSFEIFLNYVEIWRDAARKVHCLPVHVYSKMFTRFYYSLSRIDERSTPDNIGDIFHRYIVVFLNAVLFEEFLYRGNFDKISLDRKNPTSHDQIFNNNLKKVLSLEETKLTSFFNWLVSCPLWACYIRKESFLYTSFSDLTEFNKGEETKGRLGAIPFFDNYDIDQYTKFIDQYNIYDELTKIKITENYTES